MDINSWDNLSEEERNAKISQLSDEELMALSDSQDSTPQSQMSDAQIQAPTLLRGLTLDQQEKVLKVQGPLITPPAEGTISSTIGGGRLGSIAEGAVNAAIAIPNFASDFLEGITSFTGLKTPAEKMADQYRFENEMDQKNITGGERKIKQLGYVLGDAASQAIRSPLNPINSINPTGIGKNTVVKIATTALANGGLALLSEGLAQTAEELGGNIGDKRVATALNTGVRTAEMSAAFGVASGLAKTGYGKVILPLAQKYDQSQEANKIVKRLTEEVGEADKSTTIVNNTLSRFRNRVSRMSDVLKNRKASIDSQFENESNKLLDKTRQRILSENLDLTKQIDDTDVLLTAADEGIQKLRLETLKTYSSGLENTKAIINDSYDDILKGQNGLKTLEIQQHLPALEKELSPILSEDEDVNKNFIALMRKVFPQVSINNLKDVAETVAANDGKFTVAQAHQLRQGLNDITAKKGFSGPLYEQTQRIKNISNDIADDIGNVVGDDYKAVNSLYRKFIDARELNDRYIGREEKSILGFDDTYKSSIVALPGKEAKTRYGASSALEEVASQIGKADESLVAFFKGKRNDLSPLSEEVLLQNEKVAALGHTVELFDAAGMPNSIADNLNLLAKKQLHKSSLIKLKEDLVGMIEHNPDKKAASILASSPEMQQLESLKDSQLGEIANKQGVWKAKENKLISIAQSKKDKAIQTEARVAGEITRLEGKISGKDADVVALNNALMKIGWTSNSALLRKGMIQLTALNSLMAYAPELSAMAKKGIETVDSYIVNKLIKLTKNGSSEAVRPMLSKAWTFATRQVARLQEKREQDEEKRREALFRSME
jgi:hypothetical protein